MRVVQHLIEERGAKVQADQVESARLWARPVIGRYLISKCEEPLRNNQMILSQSEFKVSGRCYCALLDETLF